MEKPHIVAIPYPAQGHVIPLLELMQILAKRGFKITFVNTDFNHKRVMNALSEEDNVAERINFVSLPDGLEPWEDRNELTKLSEAINRVMIGKFVQLIENIKKLEEKNICVISDMGSALRVAEKFQIRRAYFWPASIAMLSLMVYAQKMVDDGFLDRNGTSTGDQTYQLSPTMPTIRATSLPWSFIKDPKIQKIMFQNMLKLNKELEVAEYKISNSLYDLEPVASSLLRTVLPIGPLMAINRLGISAGQFWPQDSSCLKWLDQQPINSVIYVAFGSFTVFENAQFKELALGLELTNRPFLWVVRPDITNETDNAYPEGFKERVANHGRTVGWAPQQAVLSHPSIACFLTHCGWNSTMEGISNGVPFLCWPYFTDQFINESYICDIWKVGLGFDRDNRGMISREEIKDKVEKILTCKSYIKKALELKKKAVDSVEEGGSSHDNLENFISWMKS